MYCINVKGYTLHCDQPNIWFYLPEPHGCAWMPTVAQQCSGFLLKKIRHLCTMHAEFWNHCRKSCVKQRKLQLYYLKAHIYCIEVFSSSFSPVHPSSVLGTCLQGNPLQVILWAWLKTWCDMRWYGMGVAWCSMAWCGTSLVCCGVVSQHATLIPHCATSHHTTGAPCYTMHTNATPHHLCLDNALLTLESLLSSAQ